MNYSFYFRIKVNDDYKENGYCEQSGLGIAKNFADATKQIEEFYGDDLISIEHLELGNEESTLFILPDEICRKYCDEDGLAFY